MNELSVKEIINQLQTHFTITEIAANDFKPSQKHQLSMYVDNKWYSLEVKESIYNPKDPIDSLDSAILTKYILSPIFNINYFIFSNKVSNTLSVSFELIFLFPKFIKLFI